MTEDVNNKRNRYLGKAVSGRTRVVGVIAFPVHHSLSPAMHNAAFRELGLDYIYVPFNVHPDNLEDAAKGIRALGIVGVNVTIPHKESVIAYLDWVSHDAEQIHSVNTIHNIDGELRGYSTDGAGFVESLKAVGRSPDGLRAVLLGAGGSARAIAHALVSGGSEVVIANRTVSRGEELANALNAIFGAFRAKAVPLESDAVREAIAAADLLVNCTSVGMYPRSEEQPIPAEWLHDRLFVYDLIYNPMETRLLKAAKEVGCPCMNGVKMLVYQGALSFRMWTGVEAPTEVMERAVISGLQDML